MRIEIDTKQDSKEEMRHLATMLHALAGSSGSITSDSRFPDPRDDRIHKKLARKGLFDSPSKPPASGLFGMFDDGPSLELASTAEPASQSGDLFSIFNSDPAPQSAPTASSLLGESMSAKSSPAILDPFGGSADPQQESDGQSAQELLDDDRIIPY